MDLLVNSRHGNSSVTVMEQQSTPGLDTALTIHIAIQILVYILIIPTGMVLGMIKSKFHIPAQSAGILLSTVSCFFGKSHGGFQYGANIHSLTGPALMALLWMQAAAGTYLHFAKGSKSHLGNLVLRSHRIMGQLMLLLSAAQMTNGVLTARNFCGGYYFSNCATHSAFGLAFLAHGTFWMIIMHGRPSSLRRSGRSVDFFDALHLAAWGVINSFTEHNWGERWTARDLEHTSTGVLWVCAGSVAIWQTCRRGGKRSPIVGVMFMLTGWMFAQHPQPFEFATKYHALMGKTLMALGLVRIIEIALIFKDKDPDLKEGEMNSFQYLTIYLCFATGFMFLGATEQGLRSASKFGITHVTYMICLNCLAFLYFLLSILVQVYVSGTPRTTKLADELHVHLDKEVPDYEMESLLAS